MGKWKSEKEVLFVDDLANALVYFMNKQFNGTIINIGSTIEHTSKNYVLMICEKMNLMVG